MKNTRLTRKERTTTSRLSQMPWYQVNFQQSKSMVPSQFPWYFVVPSQFPTELKE